jgi:hypothetical protein
LLCFRSLWRARISWPPKLVLLYRSAVKRGRTAQVSAHVVSLRDREAHSAGTSVRPFLYTHGIASTYTTVFFARYGGGVVNVMVCRRIHDVYAIR